MTPAHRAQDACGPGLHRQVYVLADARQIANRLDQAVTRVAWMRAREPDSSNTCDVVDFRQELSKVAVRIVWSLVVIDDLPEQVNFHTSGCHGFAYVGEYI